MLEQKDFDFREGFPFISSRDDIERIFPVRSMSTSSQTTTLKKFIRVNLVIFTKRIVVILVRKNSMIQIRS